MSNDAYPEETAEQRIARRRRERRSRRLATAAVVGVIAVIAVLVAAKLGGGGAGHQATAAGATTRSGEPDRQSAPADAVAKLTGVPIPVLVAATAKVSGLHTATPLPGPALTASDGKPELLYIGAEFCPFCASERFAMVMALSHFGTFANLQETHSGVNDGDIPTFSFYGSTFTSPYLTFEPVEAETNQLVGSRYSPLQQLTADQQSVWDQLSPDHGFPTLDIGGKWSLLTAQLPPQYLAKQSFAQIVDSIGTTNNIVGAGLDAAAAYLIKYICSTTGDQPADTCSAVSSLSLPSGS